MAQSGYTPILIYASGTASNVPLAANLTSSASGAELGLNYADGKLYYKNSSGVVTLLASAAGAAGDVVGPASATDNALARFDTTTGKLIQNSVGILSDAGVLTGLTGLTSSGNITLSSLTSTRVPYASTGGLLVDSANMTFNGTRLTVADLADSGLTAGRVTYASSGGALVDSANLTFDGTTLTANALTVTNAVTLSAATANGVVYANGSKVLTTGSALTFDGANFSVGASPLSGVKAYFATQSGNNTVRLDCGPGGASTSDLTFGAYGFFAVAGLRFEDANGLLRMYGDASRALAFNANGSEQMRLTSTGLGIGTSSPGASLHAAGAISSTPTGSGFLAGLNGSFGQAKIYGSTGGILDFGASGADASARILSTNAGDDLQFYTNGPASLTERMRLDSSGNLGLGVTPSAWSGIKALQVGGGNALMFTGANAYGQFYMLNNAYYNGSNYIYQYTQAAASYVQNQGAHQWLTAPSGTAGNAITFTQAMTLDAFGSVQLGTTNNSGSARRLIIKGSGTADGAIVLKSSSTAEGGNAGFLLQSFGTNSEAYLWNFENQPMIFGTNNTERARIDSSGNMLIGATSAISTLTVRPPEGGGIALQRPGASGTHLLISTNAGGGTPNYTTTYDTFNNDMRFSTAAAGGTGGTISFLTNTSGTATERARIPGGGGLTVYSATTANDTIDACSNQSAGTTYSTFIGRHSATGVYTGTVSVRIFTNGNIVNTNNSYGAISDVKLKENIIDATPKLEKLNQVRVVNFNMVGETQKQLGVIAQELEQVFPGMVEETPDRDAEGNDLGTVTKGVKYSVFVPMLIKAIQELKAEFDAYKASHP
jgi:hypothetical protein